MNIEVARQSPHGLDYLQTECITFCTSFQTASTSLVASISLTFFIDFKNSTVGSVSSWNVPNRFCIVSLLSSTRPDVSALFKQRSVNISSLHAKLIATLHATNSFSNMMACSKLRGNPSNKYLSPFKLTISSFSILSTNSVGTNLPSAIICLICAPNIFVSSLTTLRNKSPVEIWINPYFSTMRWHCVPLPLPGPPNTNTICKSLSPFTYLQCSTNDIWSKFTSFGSCTLGLFGL
mmetsp:Transcript_53135/g.84801  ORF Transcript_53135/g.84801 Transcript_53135/m.84801 type:complete len:235 (-) Transcript_53135:1343-2047(-)